MRLARRIETLERRTPVRETCPRCGRGPPRPGDPEEYTIEWDDGTPPEPDEECPGCRRRSVYRLTLDKGG